MAARIGLSATHATSRFFAAHEPSRTVPLHQKGRLKFLFADEALWRLSRDPLVIKATRVDAMAGLVDLMDTALGALPRLKLPSLILYGAHDQLIPQRSFDSLVELLPRRPPARWRAAFYPQGS